MKGMLKSAVEIVQKFLQVMGYPTVTVEYPYVSKPLVKGARLRLENDFSECSVCGECQNVCPTKAIEIVSEQFSQQIRRPMNSKGQPLQGLISQFRLDYSKCVSCGICVNVCPASSLKFERVFQPPKYQVLALKEDLVHIPRSMRQFDQ